MPVWLALTASQFPPATGAVEAKSSLPWDVLRHEIRVEYGEVATDPKKGYHFHTGERLAEMLGYEAEDI